MAAKFVESISDDRRIHKQGIAGPIAHMTTLAKVGLITDGERDAIVAGLKSIETDIEAGISSSTKAWKTSIWSSRTR